MRLIDLNLSWNTLAGEPPKLITSRTNQNSPRALAKSEIEAKAKEEAAIKKESKWSPTKKSAKPTIQKV